MANGVFQKPAPFNVEWVAIHPPVRDMALHFLSDVGSALLSRLRALWESEHLTIRNSECQALTGMPTTRVSICRKIGFCLCARQPLQRFVKAFQQALRRSFQKDSQLRPSLDMGMVVLALRSPSEVDTRYYHLAFQNLNTWEASIMPLAEDRDNVWRMGAAQACGKLALRLASSDTCLGLQDLWRALETCSLETSWTVDFWCLDDSPHREEHFVPGDVLASKHPHRPVQFWPTTGGRGSRSMARPQRPRQAAQPSAALALEDSDGAMSNVDDDVDHDVEIAESESSNGAYGGEDEDSNLDRLALRIGDDLDLATICGWVDEPLEEEGVNDPDPFGEESTRLDLGGCPSAEPALPPGSSGHALPAPPIPQPLPPPPAPIVGERPAQAEERRAHKDLTNTYIDVDIGRVLAGIRHQRMCSRTAIIGIIENNPTFALGNRSIAHQL